MIKDLSGYLQPICFCKIYENKLKDGEKVRDMPVDEMTEDDPLTRDQFID